MGPIQSTINVTPNFIRPASIGEININKENKLYGI